MKKPILFLCLLFGTIMVFSSCVKKEGCTSQYANNYCEKCKEDDGSCLHESTVRFWVSNATIDNLIANDYEYISINVDGIYVGKMLIYEFMPTYPNYGAELSYTKGLGNSISKTFSCTFSLKKSGIGGSEEFRDVEFDASKSPSSYEFVY